MLPCGCFLPFIEGIIFLPIQKSCFLLVGAIPTYSRCFKSHSNIPTTPPQSYITYRFWPKKTAQQTNERQNKTKYNKPKHNKTKYNKQTNKRQHHIPYHQPSGPLKKKPTDRYQANPPSSKGTLAVLWKQFHWTHTTVGGLASTTRPSRPLKKNNNIPLPET